MNKYINAKKLYDRQRELESDAEAELMKAAEEGDTNKFDYWKTVKALRDFFCWDILAAMIAEEKNETIIDVSEFMEENEEWLNKEFVDSSRQVTLMDLIEDYFIKREKM